LQHLGSKSPGCLKIAQRIFGLRIDRASQRKTPSSKPYTLRSGRVIGLIIQGPGHFTEMSQISMRFTKFGEVAVNPWSRLRLKCWWHLSRGASPPSGCSAGSCYEGILSTSGRRRVADPPKWTRAFSCFFHTRAISRA
jgi:hypothetical protein